MPDVRVDLIQLPMSVTGAVGAMRALSARYPDRRLVLRNVREGYEVFYRSEDPPPEQEWMEIEGETFCRECTFKLAVEERANRTDTHYSLLRPSDKDWAETSADLVCDHCGQTPADKAEEAP